MYHPARLTDFHSANRRIFIHQVGRFSFGKSADSDVQGTEGKQADKDETPV